MCYSWLSWDIHLVRNIGKITMRTLVWAQNKAIQFGNCQILCVISQLVSVMRDYAAEFGNCQNQIRILPVTAWFCHRAIAFPSIVACPEHVMGVNQTTDQVVGSGCHLAIAKIRFGFCRLVTSAWFCTGRTMSCSLSATRNGGESDRR